MQFHIQSKRPNKWPCSFRLQTVVSLSLTLLVLASSGSEAIVKQQQQQQQQQRSDDPSQAAISAGSHKVSPVGAASSSQQSAVASISVAQSAPVSVSAAQQQQPGSQSSVRSDSAYHQQAGPYGPASGSAASNMGPKSSSSYGIDNMSMAASNNDQSYQAAANSVNMALANSGIFGNSQNGNYATQAGSASSQSGSGSAAPSQANSVQQLNPLHYFYYPPKDGGSGAAANSQPNKQSADSNSNYQNSNNNNNNGNMAAYPMYADQLNGASMASPEAAASSQESSYISQAGGSDLSALYGPSSSQPSSGSSYVPDLSVYSSNLSPAAQPAPTGQASQQQPSSSISFNGPASSSSSSPSSSSASSSSSSSSSNGINLNQQGGQYDQMNTHMGGHQGVFPFNQMGDLSTSNFGNNAGGMSQASYMSPHAQPSEQQPQQQLPGIQHDHYANSAQQQSQAPQFSLSASQLNPSAVPPPMTMSPSGGQQGSSLFNTASLFQQQQPQQPSPQQQAINNNNNQNLLAQQYLNAYMNQQQQQYNQLMGQQSVPDMTVAGPPSVAPASSSAVTSGTSKRFGISSFIMPMLALAGLSLLIPTMSNIGTAVGRKKRSIEDNRQQQIAFDSVNGASQIAKELSIGEYMDKIERYYSIYKNAVENDDCLNRLICEFGDAVKDITGKSAVVTVIEKLVPNWMAGKVHLFKEAALDNKEGKEKCKKYVCQSNRRQH